jgi:hypothetical protein
MVQEHCSVETLHSRFMRWEVGVDERMNFDPLTQHVFTFSVSLSSE